MRLNDQVALVTGAAQGIGAGIVQRLLDDGARVIAMDRQPLPSGQWQRDIADGSVLPVAADVTDVPRTQDAIGAATRHFGRLDVAVCNAGVFETAPFLDIDIDTWNRHIAVNLTGVFVTAQAAARAMVSGGSIVFVTSISAESPSARTAPYVASKGGARMLAAAMAWELGPVGIRVNCVAPGIVDTPLNADYLTDDARREIGAMLPLGRVAQPRDIADVVAFLASDEARYVTGNTIRADGGKILGWRP